MNKKRAIHLLVLTTFLSASVLGAAPVKVVMKDGSIVNGDMVGIEDGTLTLQSESGKSKDISVSKIKKIFDADGKSIPLSGASSGSTSDASAEEMPAKREMSDDSSSDEDRPSRRSSRRAKKAPRKSNGGKTAGIIMGAAGLGVALVGILVWSYGEGEMSAATSTYCPKYGYCSDGNFYDYSISGKTGYYTYSEYERYYYGQTYSYTGIVVTIVGAAVGITGVIIGATSSSRQASLMHLEDGQVAWAVPQMNYNPQMDKGELTLLTAKF